MTYQNHTALLIDAENTPLAKLTSYLENACPFGREITLKRAYGNWSNPCLRNWEPLLRGHAIRAVQLFDCAAGKNAADIALVADAMELLHTGQYDTFIIMSSDSDYTPLVMKLREAGVCVMGIGRDDAPEAYRNACTNYLCFHNIYTEDPDSLQALLNRCEFGEEDDPEDTAFSEEDLFRGLESVNLFDCGEVERDPDIERECKSILDELFGEEAAEEPEDGDGDMSCHLVDDDLQWETIPAADENGGVIWDTLADDFCPVTHFGQDSAEMKGVHKLLCIAYHYCKGEDGYALLSSIGNFIKEIRPEFDCRDYGFQKLHQMLQAYPDQYQVISYPVKAKAAIMAFRCCA